MVSYKNTSGLISCTQIDCEVVVSRMNDWANVSEKMIYHSVHNMIHAKFLVTFGAGSNTNKIEAKMYIFFKVVTNQNRHALKLATVLTSTVRPK